MPLYQIGFIREVINLAPKPTKEINQRSLYRVGNINRNEWTIFTHGKKILPAVMPLSSEIFYAALEASRPGRSRKVERMAWMTFPGQSEVMDVSQFWQNRMGAIRD